MIYIYIYNPMHNDVSMCKIHTSSKHASKNRELIYTIVYSAQLTRSAILNSD